MTNPAQVFKEAIEQGPEISLDDLRKLRRLTQDNRHTEAYIMASGMINNPTLADRFKKIFWVQKREGYLSPEASAQRYKLYQELVRDAKAVFSSESFNAFYQSL